MLAAIAFTLLFVANLLAGRITFAVGVALALASLRLLAARRAWWAALPAVLSGLASPVAALFLGVVAAVLVLFAPGWRRQACSGWVRPRPSRCIAVAVLFPDPGRMLFTRDALKPSLLRLARPDPGAVRPQGAARPLGCGRVARARAGWPISSRVPSGAMPNASRCSGDCRSCWPTPRCPRSPWCWWPFRWSGGPSATSARSCAHARDASASRSFYTPLLDELAKVWDGTRRVEVVDPRTHWSSAYVAEKIPIARGWERQIDNARNPIFYGRARLDAASYRHFLDEYAVGWVALPNTKLDFASVAEARLVRRRPRLPVCGLAKRRLDAVCGQPAETPRRWEPHRDVSRPDRSSPRGAEGRSGRGAAAALVALVARGQRTLRTPGEWTYVRAEHAGPITVSVR